MPSSCRWAVPRGEQALDHHACSPGTRSSTWSRRSRLPQFCVGHVSSTSLNLGCLRGRQPYSRRERRMFERVRRPFHPEVKANPGELARKGGKSIGQIAKGLGARRSKRASVQRGRRPLEVSYNTAGRSGSDRSAPCRRLPRKLDHASSSATFVRRRDEMSKRAHSFIVPAFPSHRVNPSLVIPVSLIGHSEPAPV